ncbi:MAG TPA: serine/threonine-protein kinase [Gemmataceae bacterium]|nr:serine/threonine-protein kinase [Gemmataceae bacterium]
MVSSDLGACEWFVWDLRRSGLIDRGQLDQVVGEFLKRNPRAEPPSLANYLVGQNVLTPFQADRILAGKSQGLVLGPFILADAVGSGSMGQVYKAQSKTDNQWYAVKVLPRRSMWNVRLARRQVRAFSQFSHHAVVPFVDVGTAGGQHYLVWPFVDGETLESRVQRDGRLSTEVASQLMSQVSQGLALAHGNGIFHGLIKPSNILIGPDGQARILDFGIGSLLAENEGESLVDTMSTANTLTSGLDCSSPESIMEPTNRTAKGDQYSLGCVLYYSLAGQYPFPDGTAVEKMMAHQFKQPTPLREVAPHVPDGLAAIVERLMQKSPDGRYAGADEIVDALQPFTTGHSRGGGGSHNGTRPAGSHHGSRSAHPPAPPPAPAPRQAIRVTSNAQVPTPAGGPLTPVPSAPAHSPPVARQAEPPRAKPAPPARTAEPPPAPLAKPPAAPALPTRGSVRNKPAPPPARAIHVSPVPEAPHARGRARVATARPVPAGAAVDNAPWAEPEKESRVGPALVFIVAALITGVVYLVGKSFMGN